MLKQVSENFWEGTSKEPVSPDVTFYTKIYQGQSCSSYMMDVIFIVASIISNKVYERITSDKEKLVPPMDPSASKLHCFPWVQNRLKSHNLDCPLSKPYTRSI